eukprot:TRINITY_DN35506_c0_g1_i1.p1 TRINITY_DN35506_c0_g1~~TRINITY_DN35506_c0_g1_i1.p1  ORF type:complete len:136 (-),score=46.03 TRINITY_DN35506_c0_g1_i1:89-496(-)
MDVVHVKEDNKVYMCKEHEHVGPAERDVVSKVNLVSHLDGESKKKGTSDRKTIIGGKTTQCSPDNILKKISDKMRKMSDIKRQEAVIEEKEAQLRKIVKRRKKIEEKERDCLAEMRDVRKRLKILKRDSGNQKRR